MVKSHFFVGTVVRCSVVMTKSVSQRSTNFWHRMEDNSRSATLLESTSQEGSNGHKVVGRNREMLCRGDQERSFISDVARKENMLKESPMASHAYLTVP